MWFLIKSAFWFSVVLISLPLLGGGDSEEASSNQAPPIAVGDTLAAIGVAVEDIRSICERQPAVCETGGNTLTALGHRARDGARIAYTYLDEALADSDAQLAAPAAVDGTPGTGGEAAANAMPASGDAGPDAALDSADPAMTDQPMPAAAENESESHSAATGAHIQALRVISALYPGSPLLPDTTL